LKDRKVAKTVNFNTNCWMYWKMYFL